MVESQRDMMSPERRPQNKLEFDQSPKQRAQFNTSRAGSRIQQNDMSKNVKKNPNNSTPETIKREKLPHIRMSQDAQVIQFAQGAQQQDDEEFKDQKNALDRISSDQESQNINGNYGEHGHEMHPKDILNSEIDLTSQVHQFRSSTTSLVDMVSLS